MTLLFQVQVHHYRATFIGMPQKLCSFGAMFSSIIQEVGILWDHFSQYQRINSKVSIFHREAYVRST